MSIIEEKRKVHVRYHFVGDDKGTVHYLTAKTTGFTHRKGKRFPKRGYDSSSFVTDAHDFLAEYGNLDKALAMAARLGKIVVVGKEMLEDGWKLEIVLVSEVTRRIITRVDDPTNPLVILALQAK